MHAEPAEDASRYRVVVNGDEQYSIWLEAAELPRGWSDIGFSASRDACLDHVERVWGDCCQARDGPSSSRSGVTVHELVEIQARRAPESVAVVAGDEQVTYAELDARATLLARHLGRLGVGPGTRVGLCAERGLGLVVAVLGTLKAGATYVPLDPALPAPRLAFMLADSAAAVLVTQSRLLGRVKAAPTCRVVCLDGDWAQVEQEDEGPPRTSAAPADVAYVIYTSGSTGRPKGVAMPHACVVNLLEWQALDSLAGPGTRTLQFASIGFDVAFQELFSTWSTGGTLILVSEDDQRDLAALWRLIVAQRAERLFLPPAVLGQLALVAATMELPTPALREVITAGEVLRLDEAVRALFSGLPGCRLVNQYGPTEAHVVTAYHFQGEPDQWPTLVPIGVPIPHTEAYVLSAGFRRAAVGASGELFLGGACVSRGYVNGPRLTAERFVPDPFGGRPGARLYRTGDLVRRAADGNLEFLGRLDRQVKLRGFRIEPAEIEVVLAQHPRVASCVVMLRHDSAAGPGLAAYVTVSSPDPSGPELARWLGPRLPSHMVPAAIVVVPSIPLTPNGKIDYAALPPPWGPDRDDLGSGGAPGSEMEEWLRACFSEVLGRRGAGIHESFFDLGGHSLTATQLTSRVRDRFGVDLALRQVYDNPTVAALAAVIVARQEPA